MDGALTIRHLLCRPGNEPARHRVRVTWSNGQISAVEEVVEYSAEPNLIAMPPLANAHDHGRGVRYSCHGGIHAPLEGWLPTVYCNPRVDPWLNAVVALGRHARAGISASVHCHIGTDPKAFEKEAAAIVRAARNVGIRVALVLPQRDRNLLAYGPDQSFLSLLSQEDREVVRAVWLHPPLPPREQVARVERLAEAYEEKLISILHGPIAPQWCSDALLEAVAESSARTGRRIHMHLLETRLQREWADATYPGGLLPHLDRIGLLSPRLTVAHGVWLRPDEMDLLAERGVIVSINTSSNLRLHSGRAPAAEMATRGIALGIGIDSLGLDDDNDGLREICLAHYMHSGVAFEEGLTLQELMKAANVTGARAVTGENSFGAIEPGAPADILVLDYEAIAADVIDGILDPLIVVLARATTRHVLDLYVHGRQIVAEGKVLTVPLEELEGKLAAQIREVGPQMRELRPLIERYQKCLRTFYAKRCHIQG